MEVMIKSAALALSGTLLCMIIKRTNPELSALLGMAVIAVILTAALRMSKSLQELLSLIKSMTELSGTSLGPVLKCLAIGMMCKVSAELCRDASQGSVASAIEICGSLCALAVSMPLIMSMLKTIGGMT